MMANRKSFFNILTFIIFHPFAFAQWERDTTADELNILANENLPSSKDDLEAGYKSLTDQV